MNLLLAVLLSGSIIVWKTEPPKLPHITGFEDNRFVMTVPQKHEWAVERIKKNRKQRREKK